ncbi:MAG: tRNA (adenosine(37)-N6)-threonylcarbamoyltransferase complex dimerization subunit type 1 TsaB [Saprospiraceae bacterium]|nr:tRNA (adenosine(37)-N6)-threonylcarbamoyltransferase complex dimerization subunit type 1 TsaB [Saprospiraceae bacterium]MBP6695084.1 tRNA (adenosine(37)-N6)-threonylcarbamoyltransferase complex dimerization subunit type 1 TsaB [Saprospiraceae bacterium]
MPQYILCIESSTTICSIAIFDTEGLLMGFEEETIPNSHAEKLAPLIRQCIFNSNLSFKNIAAVAISIGPGSYTSLRVGLSTAKGICYALGIPLIGIPSDHILIEGNKNLAIEKKCSGIIAMIDARRMEAYCSEYNLGTGKISENKPVILEENSFEHAFSEGGKLALCGNGAEKYYNTVDSNKFVLLEKQTSSLFMGPMSVNRFTNQKFDDTAYTNPIYVKPPNITLTKKKL